MEVYTKPADHKSNPPDSNNETINNIYSYSLSPVFLLDYKNEKPNPIYLYNMSNIYIYIDLFMLIYQVLGSFLFMIWTKLHMDSN